MSFNSEARQLNQGADQKPRMSWRSLLCQTRLQPKPQDSEQGRTPFEVDYDRLIFSKAFRRLARKTQVHPLAINDHTHNRLTHSLEVASVGRSFGKAAYSIAQSHENDKIPCVGSDFGELIQAACLAHDIGNTPFGHAGERAIRQWMSTHSNQLLSLTTAERSDLTLYEGNAQAFRIATRSVSEYEAGCTNKEGGLGLTAATLATMMKYPWGSGHPYAQAHGKYSVFQNDLPAFNWIANATGLIFSDNAYCRHPLVFLVEAADDICNAIIDIEDAIDLEVLLRIDVEEALIELSGLSHTNTIAQMRSKAIGVLISHCLRVFDENYNNIMHGQYQTPLINLIDGSKLAAFNHLNEIAKSKVYPFQKDDTLVQSCNLTLARILSAVMPSAIDIEFINADFTTRPFLDIAKKMRTEHYPDYERVMMVMDFVAGMTDNYAVSLADKIEIATRS